jgi:hypothetical protein
VKENIRSGKEIGGSGIQNDAPNDFLLETVFCNRNCIQVADMESIVWYTDL